MKRNAPEYDAWNAQMPEQEPWQEPDGFSNQLPEQKSAGAARLLPLAICAVLLVVLLAEGAFFGCGAVSWNGEMQSMCRMPSRACTRRMRAFPLVRISEP